MQTLLRAGLLLGGALLLHSLAAAIGAPHQQRRRYRPWLVEQTHRQTTSNALPEVVPTPSQTAAMEKRDEVRAAQKAMKPWPPRFSDN